MADKYYRALQLPPDGGTFLWPEESSPAKPPGADTTFFMSRGGRQLMSAPMHELLAIAERLLAQARALGRHSMVPEFQKIADATRRLIDKFNHTESTETIHLELSPLLSSLIDSGPTPASGQIIPAPTGARGSVLMVDDDEPSATVVSLLLEQRGYATMIALTGEQALQMLRSRPIDLVLLDLIMPEMNGFQTLAHMKADPQWRGIPVIILSGLSDMGTVVKGIELGADDFLPKPFNPVLLRARVEACFEKKRLRDQEEAYLKQIQAEREKSERLLLNILPAPIATRLKQGEPRIADSFPEVTVLFADLAGFSNLAARISAAELVEVLNEVFSEFDRMAEQHGLEKIKTIGDAYMVVGGLPTPRPDHAEATANLALEMMQAIERFNARRGAELGLRIGIHTGPVVAGIIGENKFAYDLWGDTVNLASRMESHGQTGCIQTSAATRERLQSKFRFQPRGRIELKGMGEMETWLLLGKT